MKTVYSNSKIFFSEQRAKEFAKKVDGDIWSYRDAFSQKVYAVKW